MEPQSRELRTPPQTFTEAVEACNKSTKEKKGYLEKEILDPMIKALKSGKVTDLGSESKFVSIVNNHPDKENYIKELGELYGIEFEVEEDPETSDLHVLSIKGDNDDLFDIDELKGQRALEDIYTVLLEKNIDISQELPEVRAIVEAKIKEFLSRGIPPEKIAKVIPRGLKRYRQEYQKSLEKSQEVAQKKKEKAQEKAELAQDIENGEANNAELAQKKQEVDNKGTELAQKKQEVDNKGTELKEEEEAKDKVIATYLQKIGKQNLEKLKGSVRFQIETDESIAEETRMGVLEKIDEVVANLETIKVGILRPEEQHLIDSAQINLAGASNAEVYADVFAKIDAGIQDEDRKKELKAKVAEKLGIVMPKERPKNASELKENLNKFEEMGVSLDRENPFVMNTSPSVIVYQHENGYICEGQVENMPEPVRFKFSKAMPAEDLNNKMNRLFIDAIFSNHENAGIIDAIMGTGTNMEGTIEQDAEEKALGDADIMEHVTRMFLGHTTSMGGRFLRTDELHSMKENMRWLVPDGDFGAFNKIDQHESVALIKYGLGIDATSTGKDNMILAGSNFQGDVGEKSYQMLYDKMYPNDKKSGYKGFMERLEKGGFTKDGAREIKEKYFGLYGSEDPDDEML